MKTVKITIETGNAAFDEWPEIEMGQILARLTAWVSTRGIVETTLRDTNGNVVGKMEVVEKAE